MSSSEYLGGEDVGTATVVFLNKAGFTVHPVRSGSKAAPCEKRKSHDTVLQMYPGVK
jgi:hypothetical protein